MSAMNAASGQKPIYTQGCALLYPAVPHINVPQVLNTLAAGGRHQCQMQWNGHHDERHPILRGRVRFDQHEIHLISVAAPADDEATRLALTEALLTDDDRKVLAGHRAYIHCLYAGGSPDPLDQLRALYHVAGALITSCAPAQAIGLLDVPALQAFTTPDALELLRWLDADPPPIGLWVRIVGLSGQRGDMWLTTRGLAHFFKPELAVNGQHVNDAESAESLLMSIALWLIQGITKLHPNDTLEMMAEEGLESKMSRWRCAVPTNDQRWFAAPYGTLILEPA